LYGNATPAAAWLAKGTSGQVVGYDANDVGPKTAKVYQTLYYPTCYTTTSTAYTGTGWYLSSGTVLTYTGTAPKICFMNIPDSSPPTATLIFRSPSAWDLTTLEVHLTFHPSVGSQNDTIINRLELACIDAGVSVVDPTFGSPASVTTTLGASPTSKLLTASWIAPTLPSGCAGGQLMYLRFSRDTTDTATTGDNWVGVTLRAKTAIILE